MGYQFFFWNFDDYPDFQQKSRGGGEGDRNMNNTICWEEEVGRWQEKYNLSTFKQLNSCTVYLILLHTPRFLLEIRVIIKISKKFLLSHKLWLIWIRMKQKKFFFFWKKKFKMADSKKLSFSTSSKAEQIPPKFHGFVLGLVGLNDAKGIHFAQPIWPWGCLT